MYAITFLDCSSLENIVCEGETAPTITATTFENVKVGGLLEVPEGAEDNYSEWLEVNSHKLGYYQWNMSGEQKNEYLILKYDVTSTENQTTIINFVSNVETMMIDGEEVTPVTKYTFSETGEHEVKIKLTDGCILDNGFNGCRNLTSIIIPDNVTSIGNYAFNSCSVLADVTIPESVTSMGIYTFLSESCGGGGGSVPESGWGKKDDEDERTFARRCLLMAHSMYKPKTVKRGFHR